MCWGAQAFSMSDTGMPPIAGALFDAWLGLVRGSLEEGELVALPVLSASMMPDLVPGKLVRIRGIEGRQCRVGDIVIFRDGNKLTAHRVLARLSVCGRGYLYQMGQASATGHWIRADRVVGLVVEAQGSDGAYSDLRTTTARQAARGCAYRQLAGDLLARGAAVTKGMARSLRRKSASS